MTRKQAVKEVVSKLGETEGFMEEHFDYLDELRASGVTNMFGAIPYLMEDRDLNRHDATIVHKAWMNSFGDE